MAIVVWEFRRHRHFFSSSNATAFPTSRKCKNFNFSLHTVPAEMPYPQKYFNEFSKTFFLLKEEEPGYFGWKFQGHTYFDSPIATLQLFQHPEKVKISISPFTLSQQECHIWSRNRNVTTFPISRKCKNFNFFLYTVPAEMLYLQKYLTNFLKVFFWLKEEEPGYCGWKLQVHRYFDFAIATLQLFQLSENVKIPIFPFTLSQRNCYISRSILRIFINFLSWKKRKVAFEVENFYCTDILV